MSSIISCRTIISYHIISYHVISYRIISYRIVSSHIISNEVIYYIMSYYHAMSHIVSSHVIYYIMSCYHVMSHIISSHLCRLGVSHCDLHAENIVEQIPWASALLLTKSKPGTFPERTQYARYGIGCECKILTFVLQSCFHGHRLWICYIFWKPNAVPPIHRGLGGMYRSWESAPRVRRSLCHSANREVRFAGTQEGGYPRRFHEGSGGNPRTGRDRVRVRVGGRERVRVCIITGMIPCMSQELGIAKAALAKKSSLKLHTDAIDFARSESEDCEHKENDCEEFEAWLRITSCHIMPYHIMSHIMSHHAISYHIIWC